MKLNEEQKKSAIQMHQKLFTQSYRDQKEKTLKELNSETDIFATCENFLALYGSSNLSTRKNILDTLFSKWEKDGYLKENQGENLNLAIVSAFKRDFKSFLKALELVSIHNNIIGFRAKILVFELKEESKSAASNDSNQSQGNNFFPDDWSIGHKMTYASGVAVILSPLIGVSVPAITLAAVGGAVIMGTADIINEQIRQGTFEEFASVFASKLKTTVTVEGAATWTMSGPVDGDGKAMKEVTGTDGNTYYEDSDGRVYTTTTSSTGEKEVVEVIPAPEIATSAGVYDSGDGYDPFGPFKRGIGA